VYAPLLVAVGVAFVAVAAVVLARFGVHPGVHLALSALSVLPIWVGLNRFLPDVADRLAERTAGSLLGREGIAETRSLFAADYGVIFGPIDHFGWFLFVALPVLAWVGARCVRDHEPRWLVVVGYASTLVTFGLVQIRFVGEATGVVAVLSGLGIVYLLSVIDLAARPTPFGKRADRVRLDLRPEGISGRDVGYAAATVLLVASLSLFMVPAVMDNVAATDAEVEAIEWIDADADEREGPDYVLNEWGRNRMFNYAVNGESNSYGYAQRNYEPLIRDPNPDAHADRFQGRVGYVAISEIEDADAPPDSGYAQLFEAHGSATPAANGSGRFRLAYVTDDDGINVFRPVSGATVAGQAAPNATVTVEMNVTVPGASFAYERRTTADTNGSYAVVVAHPGEYTVEVEGGSGEEATETTAGNRTVTVPESAVSGGERVVVDD
jgi:dolichyl-diphosphooligosaccharide--protein glycosyltransferase